MTILKALLVLAGTISLFVGLFGIFIPGLPTTPFLLLTAGLYLRGSDRLYNRLITNKYVGSYIIAFHSNKGMTLKVKLYAIFMMWMMITLSCVFFIHNPTVQYIIITIAIIGTIIMGFIVPTINISKH